MGMKTLKGTDREVKKEIYNLYCDESLHLPNDHSKIMALGGIWCPNLSLLRLFLLQMIGLDNMIRNTKNIVKIKRKRPPKTGGRNLSSSYTRIGEYYHYIV